MNVLNFKVLIQKWTDAKITFMSGSRKDESLKINYVVWTSQKDSCGTRIDADLSKLQ